TSWVKYTTPCWLRPPSPSIHRSRCDAYPILVLRVKLMGAYPGLSPRNDATAMMERKFRSFHIGISHEAHAQWLASRWWHTGQQPRAPNVLAYGGNHVAARGGRRCRALC